MGRAPAGHAVALRGNPPAGGAGAEGQVQMTGPRPAGRPWTLTDDDMLRKLLASGLKAPAIAQKMNRTVGAIQSRKSKLKAKGK
jgi:hypothetical protein